MKYFKYYIPLIGIYYCIRNASTICKTKHLDLVSAVHGITMAIIIYWSAWSWIV